MIKHGAGMKGEYRLEVSRNGSIIKETDWFDNVILTQGLDRLGLTTDNPVVSFSRIGTGTSIPLATQTQLDSQSAASTVTNSALNTTLNSGFPDYITTHTYRYSYAQGAVVGNMSEIGTGWSSGGATLFSRALILDGSGNPTTITLIAIDQLTVFYRLSVIPDLTDGVGIINIGGTDYDYTVRVRNVGSFCADSRVFSSPGAFGIPGFRPTSGALTSVVGTQLSAITASPVTAASAGTNPTIGAYSQNSYQRDDTFNWSISQGNLTGGVQIISYGWAGNQSGLMGYQMRLATTIPKDNTKTMSFTARISWAAA
jgi:hypothetical protein